MTEVGKLIDEHMSLFGEQMNNWDKFRSNSRRVGLTSLFVAIMIFIVGVLSLTEQSLTALSGTCIGFVLIVLAKVAVNLFLFTKHRRIDRDLESKKTDLTAKIEDLIRNTPEKKPLGVFAASITFARSVPRRKKKGAYFPWDDFVYQFYWR